MASALEVQAPVTFSDLKTWVIGIWFFDSCIAGVDSTKNPALNKRFGIHGYPTLLMLTDEGKEMRRLFDFEIEKKWKHSALHHIFVEFFFPSII